MVYSGELAGPLFRISELRKNPFFRNGPNSENNAPFSAAPVFGPKTRSLDFRRPQIFEQKSKNVDLFGSFFGFDFSTNSVFPLLPKVLVFHEQCAFVRSTPWF